MATDPLSPNFTGSIGKNNAASQAVLLQTYTGNRIVVEFGGAQVGLVQSIRPSDHYGLEGVSGVGDIHVLEHVPTKAVHQIAVHTMVLFNSNLRGVGIAPENADVVMQGNVFDLVVYSRDSGDVVRKYVSCSYDNGELEISAHKITVQQGIFKALDVQGTGL
ncbi:MAG: hypothetical protein P4M00_05195 [Azospirillaceae bacterium]|nr:hypothetical protein [Azospirillaceae bacterium]